MWRFLFLYYDFAMVLTVATLSDDHVPSQWRKISYPITKRLTHGKPWKFEASSGISFVFFAWHHLSNVAKAKGDMTSERVFNNVLNTLMRKFQPLCNGHHAYAIFLDNYKVMNFLGIDRRWSARFLFYINISYFFLLFKNLLQCLKCYFQTDAFVKFDTNWSKAKKKRFS